MESLNKKLFWCTHEECEFQFDNRKNLLKHYDKDHSNADLENEINEEIRTIIQEVPKDKIESPMKTREIEIPMKTREIETPMKTREIEIPMMKTREIDDQISSTIKCEICQHFYLLEDKISERNNHMYDHFKNKIEEAIGLEITKSFPNCPFEGCTYKSKYKRNKTIHYAVKHGLLQKYIFEKMNYSPIDQDDIENCTTEEIQFYDYR